MSDTQRYWKPSGILLIIKKEKKKKKKINLTEEQKNYLNILNQSEKPNALLMKRKTFFFSKHSTEINYAKGIVFQKKKKKRGKKNIMSLK